MIKFLRTADFPSVAESLMPDFAPIKKYPPHKIAELDYSCSAFLMYIGIDIDVTDQVRLHNVIFSDDFRGNIEEIFQVLYHMILLFMRMFQRSLINHLRQKAKLVFMC